MKHTLLIICSLAAINFSFGQTTPVSNEGPVFVKVEVAPSFPGGDGAWVRFLQSNLHPTVPVENGAGKGRYTVVVKFVVNTDSTLTNIVCENDPGHGMCQEAIRVIKLSAKWIPCQQNGRAVTAYHRQPITFVLD